jgi:dipeptidyl aminopeptidase/acylaminoacyl peptidase
MNRKHPNLARAALVAVLSLLTISIGEGALTAGASNGLIAFESDEGGHSDIWVMQPDGSNAVNLTNDQIEDVFPSWSPDGSKIAWTRGGRGPTGEIWVMNSDGSGKTQVTFNAFSDFLYQLVAGRNEDRIPISSRP